MRTVKACLLLVGVALPGLVLLGCQSQHHAGEAVASAPPSSLRAIQAPTGGTRADAERAMLARFVGVWSFDGWVTGADGARGSVAGTGAAVIENQHFVKLDMKVTEGSMGGRSGRKAGSLLFASEPGVGLTLTAWGDASPAMSRCTGIVEGAGSVFTFTEVRTPSGAGRVSLNTRFTSDDRWVADVRDLSAAGDPLIASYTFTRAPR